MCLGYHKIKSGCIIKIDANNNKEKASDRSRNSVHRIGDYRYFCPDFTDNPISITRRRLLYTEF